MGYEKGCRALRQLQVKFVHRMEEEDKTAEELMKEMGITGTVFAQWLTKPVFAKRYQQVLQQIRARAASLDAAAELRKARKKLRGEAAEGEEAAGPALETGMGKRLIELHGSAEAAAGMAARMGEGAAEKMMKGGVSELESEKV